MKKHFCKQLKELLENYQCCCTCNSRVENKELIGQLILCESKEDYEKVRDVLIERGFGWMNYKDETRVPWDGEVALHLEQNSVGQYMIQRCGMSYNNGEKIKASNFLCKLGY